jgi:guanine deaminase
MVMPTVHPESVDAIFSVAQKRNMRVISGKKLMDRHAPDNLLDTPRVAYDESRALIEKWHKCDRLLYAITPRFAPTSTDNQLSEAGRLAREYPDTYVHSHVAENHEEVAWVAELFPWSRSYLDVYDQFDLLRERSVFAHGIHLNDEDRDRLQLSGAALAFCPTSNTFLGSGLFDLPLNRQRNIRVGLATDVGGGTSFSMLQTLSEAYKVQQLAGNQLPPTQGIYLATLGSAEALYLEDKLGNFLPGKEADFIVLDDQPTPLISRRMQETKTIDEKLFVFMMMGDDRAIYASFIMGECAYERPVINAT